jgi:glycerophosphoryl diester phosphodiesterase
MRQLRTILLLVSGAIASADTLVIAHRGASGYLPEHTLPAVAVAHAMRADYIEQDVVLTKDDQAIVLHDTTLDRTSDVARRFPDRARDDCHFYAIDFNLSEIRQLRVGERQHAVGDAAFSGRFPGQTEILRIPTLEEEIQLIQGMNLSTGRDVGIYVELKDPAFHAEEGKDLPGIVLEKLQQYGYLKTEDRAFIQCFDADTLKSLRNRTRLSLVQLLGDEELSQARAMEIAEYADAAGPSIVDLAKAPEFVEFAHKAGLNVHPYTFRVDQLPENLDSFDQLMDFFVAGLQVDGVFTDHPDLARGYLDRISLKGNKMSAPVSE